MCEDELDLAEHDETTSIDAERAAEARRNAYYADGGDEGGRCKDASSDAGAYSPMLKDDWALKVSRRTASIDRPLEDDPWGNALVAGVAGGIAAGARAAAADAVVPFSTRHIAGHVATGVAKEVAKKEAMVAVKDIAKTVTTIGPDAPVSGAPRANDGAAPADPAGWSTNDGTSAPAPVTEPVASFVPYLVIAP